MAQVSESILINATPKECFAVVTDYLAYPEYLTETKKVKIDKKSGKTFEVTFTIHLIKEVSYTLKMVEKAPTEVSWTLVKGDILKKNTGSWSFEEVDDNQTEATYTLDVEMGLFVPGAITKMLVGSSLPKMMSAVKKRIEDSRKKKKK